MSRLLIIDDDEVARVVLGRVLEESGYEVAYASCGQSAMEAHAARPFELILTDLAMPGFGGLRLIRELRAAGDRTPIVAISGDAREHLVLASDYGADAVLAKPVKRSELVDTIDHAVMGGIDVWSHVKG